MAFLEINTVHGPVVFEQDRILGAESGKIFINDDTEFHVTIFLPGLPVNLNLATQDQANAVMAAVQELIQKRKVRNPVKPIKL